MENFIIKKLIAVAGAKQYVDVGFSCLCQMSQLYLVNLPQMRTHGLKMCKNSLCRALKYVSQNNEGNTICTFKHFQSPQKKLAKSDNYCVRIKV